MPVTNKRFDWMVGDLSRVWLHHSPSLRYTSSTVAVSTGNTLNAQQRTAALMKL